jgi:Flp pilus assembly pilin Flp
VFVNRFFKTEVGQDVIEYALLCALMASIGAGLAVSIGLNIDTAYKTIDSKHKQALGNAFGKGHGSGNPGRGNPGGDGKGDGGAGDGNGNP